MPHDAPAVTLRHAEPSDQEAIMQLCENYRLVVAASLTRFEHPQDLINMAMVAAITFAGMQAGTLIALGDLPDTDQQGADLHRVMVANFNLGIKLGKAHVARTADAVIIPFGGTAH